MLNIKKGLLIGLAALGLSLSTQASNINVGGVVWDPDSTTDFPQLQDFISDAVALNLQSGSAFGQVQKINNLNPTDFCPSCELTFTITMDKDISASTADTFVYNNFTMKFFVDNTMNYDYDAATAADGNLWLELTSSNITTVASSTGESSDTYLDVVGGLAAGNFDTNTLVNGADMKWKSHSINSYNVAQISLAGDSIPEPTSIALLGLGLIGFAASRKRKA